MNPAGPDTSGERCLSNRTVASDCPAAPDLPVLTSCDITEAAYDHVESVVPMADGFRGPAPLWHGWAVREAFEAGARWALNGGKV